MVFCKRNRKKTELALLHAAAKLFAQNGYENTRTLEIAKEAKVNEALIARYFGGKEGLLTAVLKDEVTSQSLIASDQAGCNLKELPPKTFDVGLREALKTYFENGNLEAIQKEEFMRIAMSRSLVDRAMAERVKGKVFDHQLPILSKSLVSYADGTDLNKKQIEAIAQLIAGASHTFNFLARRIHSIDEKKINLTFEILAESLELYFEKHAKN